MGRLLKIVIYAIVLILLFLWVSVLFKSCGNNNPVTDAVEDISDIATDAGSDLAEAGDDFFDDVSDEISDAGEVIEETVEEIDYSALDNEIAEDKPRSSSQTSSSSTNSSSSSSRSNVSTSTSGRYLLIAGNYLIQENAQKMRSKLDRMGYTAETVIFDESQYHSVIAGRYSDYNDAQTASGDLSASGIDNYVKRKK